MVVVDHSAIESLNTDSWYEWVDDVLRKKHLCMMPPKSAIPFGKSYFNTMPCVIPFLNVMGIKEIDRYLSRSPAVVSRLMLFDYNTGDMLALMDATKITAMRTAAAAVHAISMYANSSASVVGFMGFGNIGTAFLDLFVGHFKNRQFTIKFLEYKDHFEQASERYAAYKNIKLVPVTEVSDVVKDSDIIVSAIAFADQTLAVDSWFKKGCLVIPIHLRGFENCDLFFEKVFGDDRGQVSDFRHFKEFKCFAENSEVLRGDRPGRECDDERIISYNVGMALHDVYAGAKILKMLHSSNGNKHEVGDLSPISKKWFN